MNVLTLGTFDLPHSGHVELLRRCRALAPCGRVIVGLNTDEFVLAYKGKPPVMDYTERAEVIGNLRFVDEVRANPQRTIGGSTRRFLEALGGGLLVVGSDWRDRNYLAQLGITQDDLDDLGWYLVFVPYTPGISTTALRERLAA